MGTFFTDRRFSHGDGTVVLFPESKALEHTNFTGTAYNNLVYSMVSNKRPYAYVVEGQFLQNMYYKHEILKILLKDKILDLYKSCIIL